LGVKEYGILYYWKIIINGENMSKRWKIVTCISLVILVLIAGFIMFKTWKEREEMEKGVPLPYLPKEGEKVNLLIIAYYEGGIGVKNVNITLTDGMSLSKLTNENGSVEFPVIIGNTYTISATLGSSSKSLTYKAKPYEFIVIMISKDNNIDLLPLFFPYLS